MKNWWKQLSQREQQTTFLGAMSLFLIVVYFFMYEPLNNEIQYLRNTVTQQKNLLTWMNAADQQIELFQKQNKKIKEVTSDLLLSTISQSLEKKELQQYANEVALANQNQARLTFKEVPFDNLMAWLTTLWREHRIASTSLNITPLATSGLVQASIILKTSK